MKNDILKDWLYTNRHVKWASLTRHQCAFITSPSDLRRNSSLSKRNKRRMKKQTGYDFPNQYFVVLWSKTAVVWAGTHQKQEEGRCNQRILAYSNSSADSLANHCSGNLGNVCSWNGIMRTFFSPRGIVTMCASGPTKLARLMISNALDCSFHQRIISKGFPMLNVYFPMKY